MEDEKGGDVVMDDKRKCPVRRFRECQEDCAWWDRETKDCAITVISDGILDIYMPLGDKPVFKVEMEKTKNPTRPVGLGGLGG